jgi:hypothetical protein
MLELSYTYTGAATPMLGMSYKGTRAAPSKPDMSYILLGRRPPMLELSNKNSGSAPPSLR